MVSSTRALVRGSIAARTPRNLRVTLLGGGQRLSASDLDRGCHLVAKFRASKSSHSGQPNATVDAGSEEGAVRQGDQGLERMAVELEGHVFPGDPIGRADSPISRCSDDLTLVSRFKTLPTAGSASLELAPRSFALCLGQDHTGRYKARPRRPWKLICLAR